MTTVAFRLKASGIPAGVVLSLCGSVLGQEPLVLHVAPDGNDKAPGTEARPFGHLGHLGTR